MTLLDNNIFSMKNVCKIIFLVILTGLISIPSASAAVVCDQVFEGTHLRFDKGYQFYDVWNNDSNKNVYMNARKIRFVDNGSSTELMTSSYLDPGSAFDWTQALKDNNYAVNANSSLEVIST